MRVRILGWTPVFIFFFVLIGETAAQVERLKVGYSSIGVGQSLVWVAKEAGLFKENGLDVQLIFVGSSSLLTQAVIAGDVPIAIMSGTAAIGTSPAGSDVLLGAGTKK